VPADHDLSRCYAVRARAHAARLVAAEERRRRRASLQSLWDVRFEGLGELRTADGWRHRAFLMAGRRLLAWPEVASLERGLAPSERLLLLGHAGLTAPSPTDAQGRAAEEIVVVFGQAPDGAPARWALAVESAEEREGLARAIGEACREKLE